MMLFSEDSSNMPSPFLYKVQLSIRFEKAFFKFIPVFVLKIEQLIIKFLSDSILIPELW